MLLADISSLAATFAQGRVYRDGIRTAIIGKPNVGKSSLLNMLVGIERAIVTAIPGTTRDVLEETVVINGIPLVLWDTAGLRHTDDEVERIGVARAQAGVREAELVLAVFDVSRPFDQEDAAVITAVTGKQVVAILNKIDLPIILSEAELAAHFPQTTLIKLSSKTGMGKSELEQRIQEIIFGATVWQEQQHNFVVTNVRHRDALIKTGQSLENAIAGLRAALPLDLVAVDLHAALDHIGEITGHVTSEDILDQIFAILHWKIRERYDLRCDRCWGRTCRY